MKMSLFVLEENAKTAKSAKLPYKGYGKTATTAFILYEYQKTASFNATSYFKSFKNEMMDKLFSNDEPGYYRGFICNQKDRLFIVVWSGKILHETIARALVSKASELKMPQLDYKRMYENTLEGYDIDDWCFPIVYNSGELTTNIHKKELESLNKNRNIKDVFGLDDEQWSVMMKSAW